MNDLIIYIGLAVIIFLVFREVLTWYWKINKVVNLLEQIERNTKTPKVEKESSPTNPVSKNQPTGSVWRDGKWENK